MAPVRAPMQADQARLQIEATRAAALNRLAAAAEREAITDQQRLRLESQALGQPQIFTPEGFQPYPYGIAPPIGR